MMMPIWIIRECSINSANRRVLFFHQVSILGRLLLLLLALVWCKRLLQLERRTKKVFMYFILRMEWTVYEKMKIKKRTRSLFRGDLSL